MVIVMRPEILFPLYADVTTLKGVGPRMAPLIQKLAGPKVRDLVFYPPSGVVLRRRTTAAEAVEGEIGIFEVTIDRLIPPHRMGAPIKVRAYDGTGFIHLIWFAGSPRHIESLAPIGSTRLVTGKVEKFNNEVQISHPDHVLPPEKADEIPLAEPTYPATQGLSSRQIRKLCMASVALAPALAEWQDAAWIKQRQWPDWQTALNTVHTPQNEADLSPDAPARARLAYDELLAHQMALARRKLNRQSTPAPVLQDGEASRRLLAALPFKLTNAQARAIEEIRHDLKSVNPPLRPCFRMERPRAVCWRPCRLS